MLKKVLALAAVAVFMIGVGCSNGTNPTAPSNTGQTLEGYFNSFDLSSDVVGEYTYKSFDGTVLGYGTMGRADDGSVYTIEDRGVQVDLDMTPLELLNIFITYSNPAGTIQSGPNAGLPYYYVGQTVEYDINILSTFNEQIGGSTYAGPAVLTAEMHYASFDTNGYIVPGALMPGDPIFTWTGVISPGYQKISDTYYIPSGTLAGLDVTTARVTAPVLLGLIDVIFFDGVAGIWDPID